MNNSALLLSKPRRLFWLFVLFSSLSSLVHSSAAPSYTITDLGTLGGKESEVMRMNDAGQIVGSSQTAEGLPHAFLYTDSKMIDLGTLPDCEYSWAAGINNQGHVVGWATTHGQRSGKAFLYKNGKMEELKFSTDPETYTYAGFIDDREQILAADVQDHRESHFYLQHNTITKILALDGYTNLSINYITKQGQLIGNASPSDKMRLQVPLKAKSKRRNTYAEHYQEVLSGLDNFAFIMTGSKLKRIPPIPGFHDVHPVSANNRGQIVGFCMYLKMRAFLYSNGKSIELETIGTNTSEASCINDDGIVVGRRVIDDDTIRASVWIKGRHYDLNRLVPPHSEWILTEAFGINNQGIIIGNGTINGQTHAFALHPK